jgi:hypothetical protein
LKKEGLKEVKYAKTRHLGKAHLSAYGIELSATPQFEKYLLGQENCHKYKEIGALILSQLSVSSI